MTTNSWSFCKGVIFRVPPGTVTVHPDGKAVVNDGAEGPEVRPRVIVGGPQGTVRNQPTVAVQNDRLQRKLVEPEGVAAVVNPKTIS